MRRIYRTIRASWLSLALKRKFHVYIFSLFLILVLTVLFNVRIVDYTVGGFGVILDDNLRCGELQEALGQECKAFEDYIRSRSSENREAYVLSCAQSERCIAALPFDYDRIGSERYGRTWNIQNGYENYRISRENLFLMDVDSDAYIKKLYKVYSMQKYLRDYARELTQITMENGNAAYESKVPEFQRFPIIIGIFAVLVWIFMILFSGVMTNTIVKPAQMLADSSRRIAQNDFSGADLTVANRDEMGELVYAFNIMKHATEGYINTLKKNNEMAELLHKEELERIDMEKQLNVARLELLKSQINPHFLFNTLNMIGCMARLEDAETTEKMICSMGNLFRYTLKTFEQIIILERELKVVEDYIYIQQMRFGNRIRYDSSIEVNAGEVQIPSFSLQPIVENAIIHGLSKKESGGRLHLRIWQQDSNVIISVTDTGVGMTKESCESLKAALNSRKTSHSGIGLGNIYKRIHIMYIGGDMKIYSRKDCATTIQMILPLNGLRQDYMDETDGDRG
ncbi:MAG: sensor histidine kinase [Brotaphodocola sp.]